MSRTKDAVWDQLERQHQEWLHSDTVSSRQIEIDQQGAQDAKNISGTVGILARSPCQGKPMLNKYLATC